MTGMELGNVVTVGHVQEWIVSVVLAAVLGVGLVLWYLPRSKRD